MRKDDGGHLRMEDLESNGRPLMDFKQLCVTESFLEFEDLFDSCENNRSQGAREDEGRPGRKPLWQPRQETMVAGDREAAMETKTWHVLDVTDYH